MPDPISLNATDRIIYDYICNPISKHICFISPNIITFLCFLCTFPIMYNLYINGPLATLLFWTIFRGILDCLDGAVARRCNTSSSIGAKLDIMNDTFSLCAIFSIVFIKLIGTRYYLLLIFPIAYIMIMFGLAMNNNLQQDINQNDLIKFMHDNTVLNSVIATLLIKYILNNI